LPLAVTETTSGPFAPHRRFFAISAAALGQAPQPIRLWIRRQILNDVLPQPSSTIAAAD
jgi:hypothetical protein